MNKNKVIKKELIVALIVLCVVIIAVIALLKNPDEISENDTEKPSFELVQKLDGTYEEWLASAMVIGVSMHYPDFEVEGIYLCGSTELNDKENSNGAYIIFTSEGNEIAIHSMPLEEERTEAGTKDLYAVDLGFATFDMIDVNTIDVETYKKVEIEDLEDLMSQSLLVSIYER